MIKDSLKSSISTFHTTKIIISDNSKFTFVGSITETMFRSVPAASKILEEYKKLPSSGARTITPEMHTEIEEADKVKKRGK